jgi:hypothetical protein
LLGDDCPYALKQWFRVGMTAVSVPQEAEVYLAMVADDTSGEELMVCLCLNSSKWLNEITRAAVVTNTKSALICGGEFFSPSAITVARLLSFKPEFFRWKIYSIDVMKKVNAHRNVDYEIPDDVIINWIGVNTNVANISSMIKHELSANKNFELAKSSQIIDFATLLNKFTVHKQGGNVKKKKFKVIKSPAKTSN